MALGGLCRTRGSVEQQHRKRVKAQRELTGTRCLRLPAGGFSLWNKSVSGGSSLPLTVFLSWQRISFFFSAFELVLHLLQENYTLQSQKRETLGAYTEKLQQLSPKLFIPMSYFYLNVFSFNKEIFFLIWEASLKRYNYVKDVSVFFLEEISVVINSLLKWLNLLNNRIICFTITVIRLLLNIALCKYLDYLSLVRSSKSEVKRHPCPHPNFLLPQQIRSGSNLDSGWAAPKL